MAAELRRTGRVQSRRTSSKVPPGRTPDCSRRFRLAPLAWNHRRLRSLTLFFTLLLVASLGWTLNVPGIVDLLRSRPLRPFVSLSYNRWVFATSSALLVLAAVGLDSLAIRTPRFRWAWAVPPVATIIFFCWCVVRLFTLNRKLDEEGFASSFLIGMGLSLVALVGWAATFRTGANPMGAYGRDRLTPAGTLGIRLGRTTTGRSKCVFSPRQNPGAARGLAPRSSVGCELPASESESDLTASTTCAAMTESILEITSISSKSPAIANRRTFMPTLEPSGQCRRDGSSIIP